MWRSTGRGEGCGRSWIRWLSELRVTRLAKQVRLREIGYRVREQWDIWENKLTTGRARRFISNGMLFVFGLGNWVSSSTSTTFRLVIPCEK